MYGARMDLGEVLGLGDRLVTDYLIHSHGECVFVELVGCELIGCEDDT